MPILDKPDEKYLKPWLIRTLEPICDADPEVLSDYVLALLKHDEPEPKLRAGLERQLNEFLEAEAPSFVDKLFRTIRSKSYMPYDDGKTQTPAPSSSNEIHIPIDALVTRSPRDSRGTKRGAEDDSFRPPPKGPRLSGEHINRNLNGRGLTPSGPRPPDARSGRNGRGSRTTSSTSRGGRPKEPCRDYHTMGYCPRGELCPHAHGEEAIVPPMPFGTPGPNGLGLNPLQMMTMMQSGFPMPWMMDPSISGGYNPNDARMDMSGAPFTPDEGRAKNKQYQSSDAIDLTNTSNLPAQSSQPAGPTGEQQSTSPPIGLAPAFPPSQNGFISNAGSNVNGNTGLTAISRGRGGRGRGGYRGAPTEPGTFPNADQRPHFDDDTASSRPGGGRQDGNRTIVVEKIPQESLSLPAVSEWFTRFGNVTNVAIDTPTAKALVSFATPQEAKAAWSSQEAVFENRFVKVFWHRPLTGHGEAGTKKLAASAPLVQNMLGVEKTGTATSSTPSPTSTITGVVAPALPTSPLAPALTPAESIAARKELLERQIAEQKALFAGLESATTEEKKEIMTKLRLLSEEMKRTQISTAPTNSRTTVAPAAASPEEKKRLMREKLDRELEIHATSTTQDAIMSDDVTTPAGEGSRKGELLAELAALRKQAAEVGVPTAEIAGVTPYRTRGFQRGRGRGRGGYGRGWGGAPAPRSLKLDNRPRKLVVRGVNIDDEGVVSSIEEFYKSSGHLESLQVSGGDEAHVQFQTRATAEQALSRGAPPGSSSVSWYNAPQQPPSTLPASSEAIPQGSTSSSSPVPPDSTGTGESHHASVDSKSAVTHSSGAVSSRSTHSPSGIKPNEDDDGGWGAGGGFDD